MGNKKAITRSLFKIFCIVLAVLFLVPASSWSHGFTGKRFFPTTFMVEDPFVSDEFSFLFGHIKAPAEGDAPAAKTTSFSFEYSKRITPRLGLSVGEEYRHMDFTGNGTETGFGNLELGAKYQFLTDEVHETILSFGLTTELGGTGTRHAGAESFSVVSPVLFFGKGFGDLPESLNFLRPFAVTGVIGPNFPTSSSIETTNEETGEIDIERIPATLTWGFSLQYNLMYLQSFVKDVGLGAPLNRMVLVAELPMETCMSAACKGEVTGSINPGFVWVGKKMQLGLAAQIPINSNSGSNVGMLGLVHLFLDDLFPKGLGSPVFP